MTDILCHREQRYLSAQLSFHYDRRQIILERNKTSEELAGKYVDLYDYTDGQLEVRWKGISLPYRVFAKDQRITQTAIVENKRLGHALSLVKAQQELKRETKVLTNSEKDGYKKRPRQVYGPNFVGRPLAPKNGGDDGLRKAWKTGDKAAGLPPFPQPLEITRVISHIPTAPRRRRYK